MTSWLGLPPLAAAHGAEIDNTIGLVHILMLVLFVGWISFFLYALFRFRRSRNPVASYEGSKTHVSSWLEIAIAIAEGVLLLGFSIPLWAKRVDRFPAESESVVVHITAEQFAWNMHYPGADGQFGKTDIAKIDVQTNPLGLDRDDPAAKDDITTINQLYLPVGKPAILKLRSKDVIHSFNVPEFRVKQDIIPGFTIPVWFEPTVTTAEMRTLRGEPEFVYEIACAQLCGLGHYRMRGFVTVFPEAEYQAWLDQEAAKLLEQGEGGDDIWE